LLLKLLKTKLVKWLLIISLALLIGVPIGVRVWITCSVQDRIYSDLNQVPKCHMAIVLGNQALPGEIPSPKLASRCDKAIELYKAGKVDQLLMTGDGRASSNNEPVTMRKYAISKGVPEKAVVCDPLGMRTYDSVCRTRFIYGQKSIIVVTHSYHVPRTLFLAKAVGLDAYGISSDLPGEPRDQIRECMACVSALLDAYVLDPKPSMEKQ
jgi:SanA protein